MIEIVEVQERNKVLYEIEPMWSMGRFEYSLYCLASYTRRQERDTLLNKQRPVNVFE